MSDSHIVKLRAEVLYVRAEANQMSADEVTSAAVSLADRLLKAAEEWEMVRQIAQDHCADICGPVSRFTELHVLGCGWTRVAARAECVLRELAGEGK
jgi:hypothetical protein